MKHSLTALAVGAVLALAALTPAMAQTATTVEIPLNTWLQGLSEFVGPVLAAAVLFMIRKLPAQVQGILMSMRIEQILQKAIGFAINSVAGASPGAPLKVDVGNAVVKQALDYIVKHGPETLVKWAGGPELLREKIIARLNLVPEASAAKLAT